MKRAGRGKGRRTGMGSEQNSDGQGQDQGQADHDKQARDRTAAQNPGRAAAGNFVFLRARSAPSTTERHVRAADSPRSPHRLLLRPPRARSRWSTGCTSTDTALARAVQETSWPAAPRADLRRLRAGDGDHKAKLIRSRATTRSTARPFPVPRLDAGRGEGAVPRRCYWLARTYTRTGRSKPPAGLEFDAAPTAPAPAACSNAEAAEQLKGKPRRNSTRRTRTPRRSADRRTSTPKSRAPARDRGGEEGQPGRPDTHDYSEAADPRLFIDLLLQRGGLAARSSRRGPRVRGHRHAEREGRRASSTTCCGATTACRWRWSRRSAPSGTPASASSRRSCTPTAWRRSSAGGR